MSWIENAYDAMTVEPSWWLWTNGPGRRDWARASASLMRFCRRRSLRSPSAPCNG
jgi:hypothetical protein